MKQIPVNLASNPIEQRQWLRRVKLIAFEVAAVLSVLHVLLAWTVFDEPRAVETGQEVVEPLRAWGAEVESTMATADPRGAQRVAVSVGLANALIDQRAFPWGRLFSALETIIPDDVRLEIIQPVATVDGVRVTLTAASISGESLLEFLSALEGRSEFYAVYPGRQTVGVDGDLRLSVEALARIEPRPAATSEQQP